MELRGFLLHNSTFLVGLLVAGAAGLVARFQPQGEEEAATGEQAAMTVTEPDATLESAAAKGEQAAGAIASASAKKAHSEPPPPDNPDLVWVGRLWLLLPQLVAIVLAYAASEAIFFSRFMSYTTLGGMLILAYLVTRLPAHQARLGSAAAVAVAIYAMSFTSWGQGFRVTVPSFVSEIVEQMNKSENVHAGDMMLLRSYVVEGDFLPDMANDAERRQLEGAIAAPFTTLYTPKVPLTITVMSRSNRSEHPLGNEPNSTTPAGTIWADYFQPESFYTSKFATRLSEHTGQFWVVSEELSGHQAYLTCLLPWLADGIHSDLKVSRSRPDKEHFFTVPAKTRPTDWIDGLSNAKPRDFGRWIRVQRQPASESAAPKE
jgi:hypothetical protein